MDNGTSNLLCNMSTILSEQFNLSGMIRRVLSEEQIPSTERTPEVGDGSILRFHKTLVNREVRTTCRLVSECCLCPSDRVPQRPGSSIRDQGPNSFQNTGTVTTAQWRDPPQCLSHMGTSNLASVPPDGSTSGQKSESSSVKVRSYFKVPTSDMLVKPEKQQNSQLPILETNSEVPVIEIGDMDVQECRNMVENLVAASSDIFIQTPSESQKEELRKKQSLYLLNKEVEDSCDESQKIKAEVLFSTISYLERNIIAIVKFTKCIPGFRELSIDDQARLVRDSRVESVLIGGLRLLNLKDKVFSTFYGRHFSIEEMNLVYSKEFLEQKMGMSKKICDLNMSKEEETLLRAVSITFTDRGELDDKVAVQNIQNRLLTCLMWVIGRSGQYDVSVRLGQLFNVLVNLRDVTEIDMIQVKNVLLEAPAYTHSPVVNEFL